MTVRGRSGTGSIARGGRPPIDVRVSRSSPKGIGLLAVPVGPSPTDPFLRGRGFDGRVGEAVAMQDANGSTILAVGVGAPGTVTLDGLRRAGAAAARAAGAATSIAVDLIDAADHLPAGAAAQALTEGVLLASYSFTAHKSGPSPSRLAEVVLVSSAPDAASGASRGAVVARAVALARDLINEPPGTMTPQRLAEVATEEGRRAKITVNILDETAAASAGLGGLLGVAAGSAQPPRLLELLYEPRGVNASTPTVALVGKGITFDSGGLSLKTGVGMMTMKTDMSGAAAVIAAMTAIGELGAPVRVLGLCPATENLPSGTAIMPGDVLTIRNGKTVEVLNTDAEGRLVLADGLSLAVEAGVDAIVDVATLTGAVVTALGNRVAGLMGSDEAWSGEVSAAASRAGEAVWQLPLPEVYRKDIDSEVADLKNIGGTGGPGTLIAGLFLQEFTDELPWAHLDIAGTARSESEDGYVTKGGTGWGVRTLIELVTSGSVPLREGATRRAKWAGKTPVAMLSSGSTRDSRGSSARSGSSSRAGSAGRAGPATRSKPARLKPARSKG